MAVKDYTSQLLNTLNMYHPNINPIDFSGVADNFQKAYDKAQNKFLTNALSQALQGGDENQINSALAALDPMTAVANRLSEKNMKQQRDWQLEDAERNHQWELDRLNMQHYLAKELADYKSSIGGSESPFNSKNEFINLMGIKNNPQVWNNLPDEDKMRITARIDYMANNPETVFNKNYQGQKGKEQAKQEFEQVKNAIQDQQQQATINDAINLVDSLDSQLFMPYAGFSSAIGTLTNGGIGMDNTSNEQYGKLERTIGNIENDLIAKARSKGQTGINTIAEIKQAAKGLQLGKGKDRLRGALKAMLKISDKLDAMPTIATPIPTNNSNIQIMDADDYF